MPMTTTSSAAVASHCLGSMIQNPTWQPVFSTEMFQRPACAFGATGSPQKGESCDQRHSDQSRDNQPTPTYMDTVVPRHVLHSADSWRRVGDWRELLCWCSSFLLDLRCHLL